MSARETNKQHTEENLTAADATAIKKHLARLEAKTSGRLKVRKEGRSFEFWVDHPNQLVGRALLMNALASGDEDFLNGIISQLVHASPLGQDIDEPRLNFMLAVIKGIEPRDQLEAMLAAQMAAVHVATMTFARDVAPATIDMFNKLTRTFAMQMEALRRYRSGAEQKVTLQQVSVAEGGQAIIGNVTQAPRKDGQEKATQGKAATPPPTLPDTNVVPMTSKDQRKEHETRPVHRRKLDK